MMSPAAAEGRCRAVAGKVRQTGDTEPHPPKQRYLDVRNSRKAVCRTQSAQRGPTARPKPLHRVRTAARGASRPAWRATAPRSLMMGPPQLYICKAKAGPSPKWPPSANCVAASAPSRAELAQRWGPHPKQSHKTRKSQMRPRRSTCRLQPSAPFCRAYLLLAVQPVR